MKILITGASGYLGSILVNNIDDKDHEIFAVSLSGSPFTVGYDLTNIESVKTMMNWANPDCIIHCAAYVPDCEPGYNDIKLSSSNEQMVRNILSQSLCPILYVSSMTVYGSPSNLPVAEHSRCDPITVYAQSKLNSERLIKGSGRNGFAIRIPGLFGLPRKNGLVYNLLTAAKYNKNCVLPSKPELWSGMHVADTSQAILNLIPKIQDKFTEVNVGYNGLVSINTLVNLVNELYGSNITTACEHPNFEFDLSCYDNLTLVPASNLRKSLKTFGSEIDK